MSIPKFDVYDRLRKARESAGLDQAQMGARLGVHPKTVGRWESGASPMSSMAIRAWAEVTDVPPHWLRWGMTEAPTPPRNEAGVEAPIEPLPRLDSNQQPADYGRPVDAVADLDSKRRRVARVQRAWWIGEGEAA